MTEDDIAFVSNMIREQTDSFCAFVGAGLSKASGLRTFRGENGLLQEEDVEDLLHFDTIKNNPEEFFEFFEALKCDIEDADPNEGHRALAKIIDRKDGTLVTQNIDELVERSAENLGLGTFPVCYLHGRASGLRCLECFQAIDPDEYTYDDSCPFCDGFIRPDVILYGEPLDDEVFDFAEQAMTGCDLYLLLGTSGVVYPAASLPRRATRSGATLIEINPTQTDLTPICDFYVGGKTEEALPRIARKLDLTF